MSNRETCLICTGFSVYLFRLEGGLGYGCGDLGNFSDIDGCIPCMWGVLWFVWRCVVEPIKCALDVVLHGDVYITFLVIPIQVQSKV